MYPPVFEYSAPDTLPEVLSTLAEVGDEGRVLAGGQSLIPMMKLRLAMPAHLVDINGVSELGYIRAEDGYVAIGALARHADVSASGAASANPTIEQAVDQIADPLVRNRGTVCGSIAHCDPEGDWNSVLLATGGSVVATSSSGERVIPGEDFVVDFFTNALQPGELVTQVRIPVPSGPCGGGYLKLKRKVGDYPTVAVATHLVLDGAGRVATAGIALTSVAPHNLKVTEAERLLVGQEPTAELFAEAADIAARSCEPDSDVRGPAEYKRAVVAEYTRRGLTRALAQARGLVSAEAGAHGEKG
jgi:carbon-monoxide dehydrogenase medium subunit